MIWIVLAIIVVGFFIVRTINGGSVRKALPIPKRIELLTELIPKYQDYLGEEYKKELEEEKKLRYQKHPKYSWKTWDKDHEKYLQESYDDFLKLIGLNAILCQRLANDEQRLFEQLSDWGIYLEKLRDINIAYTGNEGYIEAGLDIPRDEVADAERAGVMQETYKRIIARAKAQGVLTKDLTPSYDKNK